MPIKAIFFDHDGTLVDSEPIHYQLWRDVLAAHGVALSAALAWFCAVSLLACLTGVGCWALAGKALVRWLKTPRRQRIFNGVLAATLVASVLGVLA